MSGARFLGGVGNGHRARRRFPLLAASRTRTPVRDIVMRNSITATALSRRFAVAITAATLVATVACSDDHVTAPKSIPEVSAPNATIYPIPTQEVTVRVKDIYGNLIQDGMIPTEWLALTAANDTVYRRIAYDNHLNPNLNVDMNPLL